MVGGDIESHGGCGRDQTSQAAGGKDNSSVLCLAVVREKSADVVLFDAKGTPRAFSYKGVIPNSDGKKVCFSSHGHDADDLLTPCFDEDGHHGVPEESCFCGIETPHLHAHVHDPNICDSNDGDDAKMKADEALMKLAKLTLHPTEEAEGVAEGEKAPLLNIPVTDSMPNQCNAVEFFNGLSSGGHGLAALQNRRRMHRVQHDDHVDYLVHDEATGVLHLEHPHESCGKDDVHGRFNFVGKRRLAGVANGNDVRLHFFEVSPRKFTILDFIKDHFAPDPGHVAAIRPVATKTTSAATTNTNTPSCCSGGTCSATAKSCTTKVAATAAPSQVPPCCAGGTCTMAATDDCCASGTCTASSFMPPEILDPLPMSSNGKTVRSTIMCTQICCSSEIPGINKAMEPLEGVTKTMINVPLKQVTVDHDPTIITAKDIEAVLNKARFGASVKRDGGAGLGATAGGSGRSQFFVEKICCASEIPAINSNLEPISGVSNVSINVTTKMVYVDHELSIVSAQALCDALNKAAFGASIKKDAGKTAAGAAPSFVTSKLKIDTGDPDTESLKHLLSAYKPSQMESFVVDVPGKDISVVHNPLLLPLQTILVHLEEETGLKATIISNGADGLSWDFPTVGQSSEEEPDSGQERMLPKPTVILSGIFWIVSMLSFIGGNWEYLKYVALLSVAFGIPGIAIKAFHTLRRFMFDSNCLMLFAAVGAVALQEYTEAAAVTFLFAISEWLEVRATTRARNALSAIVQLRPDYAFIVHPTTREHMMVPASSVPVGAIVAVKTGDKIPCDGVVVEGNSAVDESSLTGESRPVKKGPKSVVSGGTINCGQTHLMIQTTSTAENSAISRLVTLVEEAQANRSETEKIVDEFAKIYTPIVVLAALCMCTIPWAFGSETGKEWTHNGLVLIVVACPCALIISTPVTYVAGLAATAQRGVLIKGGAHLEALGLTKTICFDKTGTLTQGSYALISINSIGTKYARKEMMEYLVLMEERANHPLSLAILDGARNEGIVTPKNKKVVDHTFLAGEGLSGHIDGLQIYVGNERLFKRLGLLDNLPEEIMNLVGNWEAMAGTVGFMSIEGAGIVCAYCVADAVRPESSEVLEALGKMGIDVHMLTGDNKDAAKAIGNLVGLKPEGINSELLPEEKLSFIAHFKSSQSGRSVLSNPFSKRELVCHVGDGVNDAPALAAADIGVAMGVGAALAMETADVTLLDSNLRKLLYSVKMGRRVLWKIKENVIFSLIVKFLVLGFTVAGKVQLWAAIVSDVGAMIIVTLNGMRLLPSRKIDREKMGDIENITYHSQVSDVSQNQQKDVGIESLDIEFGSTDPIGVHSHEHGHCHGHSHDHNNKGPDTVQHSHDKEHKDCGHSHLNQHHAHGHGHSHNHQVPDAVHHSHDKEHKDCGRSHSNQHHAHEHGHSHNHQVAHAVHHSHDKEHKDCGHSHLNQHHAHEHGHSHSHQGPDVVQHSHHKEHEDHGHSHSHLHHEGQNKGKEAPDEHDHSHNRNHHKDHEDHGHSQSNQHHSHEHGHNHGHQDKKDELESDDMPAVLADFVKQADVALIEHQHFLEDLSGRGASNNAGGSTGFDDSSGFLMRDENDPEPFSSSGQGHSHSHSHNH